ncbi:MAG: TIGR03032 family protein [Chitinophagales bacterium]
MNEGLTKYPAFACTYSPEIPKILNDKCCSLMISTYQAGKVVFISPNGNDKLVQLPRTFKKAMGIAYDSGKMAIACLDEVILLANSPQLAKFYPNKPNLYDALFVPRVTYHTGYLDIHDLAFSKDNIYGVNTYFSCLIKIDEHFNFTPVWKPKFITHLESEDRCHLNGMAMQYGKPKYVTAFNQGNTPRSWKENITESGVLIDVETDDVIANKLPMPHSPRIYRNKIYLLLSATGEFVEVDPLTSNYTVITKIDGFVRGLDFIDHYAFIGLSKIRKKEGAAFSHLPIAEKAVHSGIVVINLTTGQQVGVINYLESVEEIYDVKILPQIKRPNILNTISEDYKKAVMIPSTTYWGQIEQRDADLQP